MLKYICFETKHLERLSKKQKVSRLYKRHLATLFIKHVYNERDNTHLYNDALREARKDFDKMLELPTTSSEY